jgi:hypothetical protein
VIPLGIMAAAIRAAGGGPGGGTPHAYWRVWVDRNAGTAAGTVTSVAEIEMRAIALNTNAGTPASRAFDNSTDLVSGTLVSLDGGQPWWVGYQFAAPVDVQEVFIVPQQDSNRHIRSPGSVFIEHSDDGVAWTTAASYLSVVDWPSAADAGKTFAVPYLHAGDDPAWPWVSSFVQDFGPDEATTIADLIPGVAWTLAGSAKVDSGVLLAGENTLLLPGSGSYAYCTGGAFAWGQYDVDIETSVYCHAITGANRCMMDFRHGATENIAIYAEAATAGAGKLSIYTAFGLAISHQTAMVANTWYRVKACRRGGYWKLYLDGVKSTDTYTAHSGVTYTSDGRLYIGDNYVAPSQPLDGRMGPIRITRYARQALDANHTPDALPWPDN